MYMLLSTFKISTASPRQVFCGVYLLAPRTQTDHGRRSGAGGGGDGVGSDGEASDLTRMLRLDGENKEYLQFGGFLDVRLVWCKAEVGWLCEAHRVLLFFVHDLNSRRDVCMWHGFSPLCGMLACLLACRAGGDCFCLGAYNTGTVTL